MAHAHAAVPQPHFSERCDDLGRLKEKACPTHTMGPRSLRRLRGGLTGRRAGQRFDRAHGDMKSNSAITLAPSPSTFASSLLAVER